jgi:hypothetical protein
LKGFTIPQFRLEQIAITPADPAAAQELLVAMGAQNWVKDHVTAAGNVYGEPGANEADLAFNYELFNPDKQGEFEILRYTDSENWMAEKSRGHTVSHLGMHCTAAELVEWRAFFAARHIGIAQEVFTQNHTNKAIAGKRWYNYVIFNTKAILGVDLKFIVRLEKKGGA